MGLVFLLLLVVFSAVLADEVKMPLCCGNVSYIGKSHLPKRMKGYAKRILSADAFVGVNIGTELSDMPNPTQVVALLKAQQLHHVRLFDADEAMLVALANTKISVIISVPNDQLLGVGQSNETAANQANVMPAHVPVTKQGNSL
ncbi:hypothetical protein Leryth_007884 [Lithospermum erythrorhizon]|nr:hypothetical protein Leryth_007884 [Lithospermum erythrorhizon]